MADFQSAVKALGLESLRAVELPFFGTCDLVEFATSPAVVFSAAVIVATTFYTQVLSAGPKTALNPAAWQDYPLQKKIQVSPNTAIYRFSLPRQQDILGLPIGQHVSVSAEIDGKTITRSYTPVSSDDDHGHFDLLIKTYEKGNISRHVSLLKIGDNLRVKGPKGNFRYSPDLTDHLCMIAGGTGITPMIQIMRAALKNPQDKTKISLIYANVNEEDILLRDELDELLDTHKKDLTIYFVLNNPPANWKGGAGFVTKDHIAAQFPSPTANSKVLICGPPPMVSAMKKNLDELKYPAPRTVSKLEDKVFVF